MSNIHVGKLVENLIGIKDSHYNILTHEEIDSLNDACNIIYGRFRRFDTKETIVDEHVMDVRLTRTAIGDKLHEKGYMGNDKNIETLIKSGLLQTVEDRMTDTMWQVIEDIIAYEGKGLESR